MTGRAARPADQGRQLPRRAAACAAAEPLGAVRAHRGFRGAERAGHTHAVAARVVPPILRLRGDLRYVLVRLRSGRVVSLYGLLLWAPLPFVVLRSPLREQRC